MYEYCGYRSTHTLFQLLGVARLRTASATAAAGVVQGGTAAGTEATRETGEK